MSASLLYKLKDLHDIHMRFLREIRFPLPGEVDNVDVKNGPAVIDEAVVCPPLAVMKLN